MPVWQIQLEMWAQKCRRLQARQDALEQTHAVIVDRWIDAAEALEHATQELRDLRIRYEGEK